MADVQETRASKALRERCERDGQKAIVERTGVAQPTLSQIINRKRQPGRLVARKLEKVGIRQSWWYQPPEANEAAGDAA